MHGLVDADHVDHLHPDSGIAIATSVDGEELTISDTRINIPGQDLDIDLSVPNPYDDMV